MVIPNEFLINLAPHHEVVGICFCENCRAGRLQEVADRNYSNRQLYRLFTHRLVQSEETRLERLFESTLQQIVHGKAYLTNSLENTNYRYFRSWAKTQRRFENLTQKDFNNLCRKVNEANNVFNSWESIVSNLTDYRMSSIDARRFSVNQFYQAKDITWCLRYNEQLRIGGRNVDNNVLPYPEEKYNEIVQHIERTGILGDVGNDPQTVTVLFGRLQKDFTRRANSRYRPF